MRRLLLVSNSGKPMLGHCGRLVERFLPRGGRVSVLTAARLGDEDARFAAAATALAAMGFTARHVRPHDDICAAVAEADALFVPGGNTYALLGRLHEQDAVEAIAGRVRAGLPYLGTSAGTNIAAPDILATNDWNVVGLSRFDAMGLVPFAINPHYLESDPTVAPGGETRDQRIGEYVAVRRRPVVGIEEETALLVQGDRIEVVGSGRVKVFDLAGTSRWYAPGDLLPFGACEESPS